MANIHPTAIVSPGAQIADSAVIGPYCIIGEHVKIGAGTKLVASVYIEGHVEIGENNRIYPGACLGTPPQDIGWKEDMVSYVKIGNGNILRECVTVHCGTVGSKENATTTVGDNNFIMAYCHIAHDCTVGNHVIMVPYAGVSGHVQLMDHCLISGLSGVHQFCRVGRYAMLSGGSLISKDLPPFMIEDGRNGPVRSINIVGMRRGGFSNESIRAMQQVQKIFYTEGHTVPNAIAKIKSEVLQTPEVLEFLDFVATSERGVLSGSLGRR